MAEREHAPNQENPFEDPLATDMSTTAATTLHLNGNVALTLGPDALQVNGMAKIVSLSLQLMAC